MAEIRPELWPCLWKTDGCTKGQDFAQCVRETHASWLLDTSTAGLLVPDQKERALAAAQSLGYELQIVQATAELRNRTLEVSATMTNRGVAPFYAGWPVQVVAIDSTGGEIAAGLPIALNKLLPAATDTQAVKLDLAKLASGEIKLLIGISTPLKNGRPLRFANADADPHRAGWLTLGKIVLP